MNEYVLIFTSFLDVAISHAAATQKVQGHLVCFSFVCEIAVC